jgi:fatty acid desaturase
MKKTKPNDCGEPFLSAIAGEFLGQIILYGLGAAGLWFLSQWWSAWVFFIAGIALMVLLPLYFHFRSRDKNSPAPDSSLNPDAHNRHDG